MSSSLSASVSADDLMLQQQYKRHAWLAVIGLGGFVLLYLMLSTWFAYTAWHSFGLLGSHENWLFHLIVGGASGFLALFMIKALLFVKKGQMPDLIEVTAEQQPKLFAFLHDIADSAGAPRPHRVFLSPRVNAAVFYDLSLLNLIFPAKKNLEIGLALVNALNHSEMKAVLAHEFGHFAQKTMAIGRWIYIAQQIAAHIVERRDALDKFLRVISGIDLRIAWVGWILRLIVWSIRAVLESAFRLTMMAERALSREMEYQADLVAVSQTGSDAIVHALHRLQAADEAWERAQGFLFNELQEGRLTKDAFTIQSRVMERMAMILNNAQYGKSPRLPANAPEQFRVFTAEIAQPPRMWATHPQNHEREANAKRRYLAMPIDERSAWEVFDDATALREQMTRHLVSHLNEVPEASALEESLSALDKQYDREFLRSAYRGAYLGRSFVRHVETPEQLYSAQMDKAVDGLSALYPATLANELDNLRNLEKERALLEAIRDGIYSAPGGVIRHRGNTLLKRELPQAIAQVREECRAVQERIHRHDQLCRSAHVSAAKALANGWPEYLQSLTSVLHFADHAEADLRDAYGLLNNVVAIVTADRNVSSRELKRVINAGQEVYKVLHAIYVCADQVKLSDDILARLETESWSKALGEFTLPPPGKDNINQWMDAIGGWVGGTAGALSALRHIALDLLLQAELKVAKAYRQQSQLESAPRANQVPAHYPRLLPGQERALQKRLGWWDRFQTADGLIPGLLRFVVAAGIIGFALSVSLIAVLQS
ncbi:M48 family metallopeptidase [Permianibacter aggregans]|uniref:Zn-dependent protease with chaperone function n=2 Tax=Permianibacter aggregans TaxID=1510150 RepID=A0A4R6UW47_9GAMM|nr:M48 family metallopeptidase [Permianibacter aggregans]QGX41734.1 heat-shock protein HtpX [Permianibacter aggregans]TDQ49705.1 Zn-dependent protease with chaperone function [Permianibacter aggregans]